VPAYRPFAARVARVQRLSPTFARVTVAGESLAGFAGHGFDQRINLLFLPPDGDPEAFCNGTDWAEQWQAVPAERRAPLRTYTVRAARPERCELDVDFVLHHDGGPGSRWGAAARPGDPITIIGAVAGHPGPVTDVAWAPPERAGQLLLAADESALPAASAIVETFGPGDRAIVVLEVPEPADVIGGDTPAGVDVIWLIRSRGDRLAPVVRDLLAALVPPAALAANLPADEPASADDDVWEVPDPDAGVRPGGFYAWLAGEAGTVVSLRRHLVRERGVDRRSVAFMGYWRRGRAQPN
jgi:NADPH-dependent ferric siderophore reductase